MVRADWITSAAAPDPAVPLWDRAWFGNALVLVSIVVAVAVYLFQRQGVLHSKRESTLAHVKGVEAAMRGWAQSFFGTSYEGEAAENRCELDFNTIMRGQYVQNFKVPTEPVESLIQPPGDAWPLSSDTVEAAGVALQRMTAFNQLVQQQTDFNLLHAAELRRPDITEDEKRPIAEAARKICEGIHGFAIGDAGWYGGLMEALQANVEELEVMLQRRHFLRLEGDPPEDLTAPFRNPLWPV
jgi:hypothetical protein